MTGPPLRFATWNIGGGILGASHQRGASPDLSHHADVLRAQRPDVVCLQEAHEHDDAPGQTQDLAERVGYPHWAAFPLSPSHLADGAALALGMLSRFPLHDLRLRILPAPSLTACGPDGEDWVLHDKGYLLGSIELPGGDEIHFANAHFFPLHHFGRSAAEIGFVAMWQVFSSDLLALDDAGPALAGFDLNHSPLEQVLGATLAPGHFTAALDPCAPTTPHGARRDFLLCGRRAQVRDAMVVPTLGDHFYCQVDVDVIPQTPKDESWCTGRLSARPRGAAGSATHSSRRKR